MIHERAPGGRAGGEDLDLFGGEPEDPAGKLLEAAHIIDGASRKRGHEIAGQKALYALGFAGPLEQIHKLFRCGGAGFAHEG